jgi:FAD-linked sulfhydryl oxidase
MDFRENIQKYAIAAESREALCIWMCKQHNLVNEKLGKPLFPCEIKILDQRWKQADPKNT